MRSLWAILALAAPLAPSSGCDAPPPPFAERDIAEARLGVGLLRGFFLGVATSAHQIEGGNDNDWTAWESGRHGDGRPHIANGDRCGAAVGSWTRYTEDIAMLRSLGANAYRMSIEWSRLEPREGEWNEAAAFHYRTILTALRAAGITPFVTLHHYTLPQWAAAHGGWEWEGMMVAFDGFARRAGRAFGDLVDYWVTVNEPTAIAAAAYGVGIWPPGVSDGRRAFRVLGNMIRAHGVGAQALRATDRGDADHDGYATRIGMAHNVTLMQPGSSSPLDRALAAAADDVFNESAPRAARTGWIRLHVPGLVAIDEYAPEMHGSFDYLGINYYHREHVRVDFASPTLAQHYVPEASPRSDIEWEIWAEGFYQTLVRFGRHGWPIYVLENGVADAADAMRPRFLRAHFYALQRAVEDGADVRGYFHWSLTDNFEWAQGYGPRFGLFEVDRADPTLPRRERPSVAVFREIARGLELLSE